MTKDELRAWIIRQFPPLSVSAEIVREIVENSQVVNIPAGTVLLETGHTIQHIPLVIRGGIKVSRADAYGRELLLYYIHPGESCAMTLSSGMRRERSRVNAVTQQPTELLIIPTNLTWQLAWKHPAWLEFVMDVYNRRFDELLELVESVSFRQLDERLLRYLQDKSALLNTRILPLSHQEIADDLGSARAVISRMLKQMENRGLLKLMRGRIRILELPQQV